MSNWKDFFKDARGEFNIFTCIALAAAAELLVMIPAGRYLNWALLSEKELYMLVLIYLIAAVGDYLLGIFLNKMPATMNINTSGGDASLTAAAGGSTATSNTDSPPGEPGEPATPIATPEP